MQNIIAITQIVISVAVIILILLQQRDTDVSGFLGGGGGGGGAFYQQRRGLERVLFISTIVLTAVFAILAVVSLFLNPAVAPLTPDVTTADGTPVTIDGGEQVIEILPPTSTQNQ